MRNFTIYPKHNNITADIYVYRGPVKHYDDVIESNGYYETTADTRSKAINNLKFKAKKANGYADNAKISIDEDLVDNVSETLDQNLTHIICPQCGVRLTDGGYCPECEEYYGE